MADLNKIVDQLSTLTVLEAAELAKLLDEKGSGRGVISICAAGGQGVVAILEAA